MTVLSTLRNPHGFTSKEEAKEKAINLMTQYIHQSLLNPTPISFDPDLKLHRNAQVATEADDDEDQAGNNDSSTSSKPYSHTASVTYTSSAGIETKLVVPVLHKEHTAEDGARTLKFIDERIWTLEAYS